MDSKSKIYKNAERKKYNITTAQRNEYRKISQNSRLAKLAAEKGILEKIHDINHPNLFPELLMPKKEKNGLRYLSLFSGGGGLDLGCDYAGYSHVASYELIPICGETLKLNRPQWSVFSGLQHGNVTNVDWNIYREKIDVIHGGPPCQPFSIAGEQKGKEDDRNMWGEFNRAVNIIKPRAFIAENVLGLMNPKFEGFVKKYILEELKSYKIKMFEMHSADYGVPQRRRRVFFVGFRNKKDFINFTQPEATHSWDRFRKSKQNKALNLNIFDYDKPNTMGVRESLGLPNINFDDLAPTIRSAFTGKRNTTSILNSSAGQKSWGDLEIWASGVQSNREKASAFPAKFGHFRLSVQDCGIIQGFPESWKFAGAVYQILGQIGNSVSPPVAYAVALNVAKALKSV
ncbi:MAG: DNA (cytosine-5-)-methyltransferase [Cyanobacteria bacterium J06621_8]